MKSDAVIVKIVAFGDFIFMFLGLDVVLYILGYFLIVYVTLIRLIVLYSRCRVNRSINLSVVLYFVILLLLPLCTVWASECGVPNLWGASPLSCSPLRITPPHIIVNREER